MSSSPISSFDVEWAEGKSPAKLKYLLEKTGKQYSAFSFSKPDVLKGLADDDYERITMLKMRQAERDRLKAQLSKESQ